MAARHFPGLTRKLRPCRQTNNSSLRRCSHLCTGRSIIMICIAVFVFGNSMLDVNLSVNAKRTGGSVSRNPLNGARRTQSLEKASFFRGGMLTKSKPDSSQPPTPPADATHNDKSVDQPETEPVQKHPEDDPRILMLIRLLFVTYYASLGSLLPYLPVYYHSLGHGGQVIGMLGAIKPFTTFLVAPFWGIVSDSTGSPFTVLYFTFMVSLLGQLLVAWKHNPNYIMVMVFITAFFNAPVKSLLDSMVMSNLNDRSRYGRLRLWGQLGFGIGSSGVGVLLSKSKHRQYHPPSADHSILQILDDFWQSLTGYKLLFLTYAILSVPTWFCIRAFHTMHDKNQREREEALEAQGGDGTTKKEVTNVGVWDGVKVLFHDSDALLFFFLVFVVGISSGIIENFAYVRIREVGGTGKDMGLSRLVSSMAGAPMFWFSGPLTELLGADRVIVLSLISYIIRFVIYALMRHPLQGLPAEAMRGVTFAAFWSTATIYASRIAPPGMGATMLMFLNAMYGGLGQSAGAIVGGKLQSKFGTVTTFMYCALFDLCFVTFVIAYLKIRKESNFKDPQPIVPKSKAIEEERILNQDQQHHGKA